MKLVTYMEMEIEELEEIIEKAYGHSVELVADMELNNGSHFNIKETKHTLDDYDQKDLDEFKHSGNAQYKTYAIFQDLVNQGFLDEGLEYHVVVDW